MKIKRLKIGQKPLKPNQVLPLKQPINYTFHYWVTHYSIEMPITANGRIDGSICKMLLPKYNFQIENVTQRLIIIITLTW